MKSKPESKGLTKSILLVASTSSYFGGTGVAAYVASKHGVLGLLRASQNVARENGVRLNAIAPFLTPTHITAGFAHRWDEAGLEKNTPDRVAEAIALVALDPERQGNCVLVRYFRASFVVQADQIFRLLESIFENWRVLERSSSLLGWGRIILSLWRNVCSSLLVLEDMHFLSTST